MLTLLFRKMLNTKWLVLCLFLGFLMAASMLSTMPIYTDASLQRLLIKDMQSYQAETGIYPGAYQVSKTLNVNLTYEDRKAYAEYIPDAVSHRVKNIDMPIGSMKTILSDEFMYLSTTNTNSMRIKVISMSDFEDHIEITKGRMYKSGVQNGFLEVIVNEVVLKTLAVNLDGEYNIVNAMDTSLESVPIKVVGIYKEKNQNDIYWSEGMNTYLNGFFMHSGAFYDHYLKYNSTALSNIKVMYNFDYQKLDLNKLTDVSKAIESDFKFYKDDSLNFTMGVNSILAEYGSRANSLSRILWVLQIPAIVMLAFYLFMVSKLNIEQEKNEIAVFKSRGASAKQIFGIYTLQTAILGLGTWILAPIVGLSLCTFLGVSNGFLEFVNRPALASRITFTAVLYALLAVIVFIMTTVLPVIPSSRMTIVQHKQRKTRKFNFALWEWLFVDVLLIAGSFLLYNDFTKGIAKEIDAGTFKGTGEINGVVFVLSVMLIMGLGLLFIRLYPLLIRLIYTIGKKRWSPSQYIALTSISRAGGGRERFLMLFLVITFAFGIFSANTARAINNNKEDRIYYTAGADISLRQFWSSSSISSDGGTDQYVEPDFDRIATLPGVELATKVLRIESAKISGKSASTETTMLAIEPNKFDEVSWIRSDLLPVHKRNYTNALVDYPSGAIASKNMMDKGYELGDTITVSWGRNKLDFTIIAFVEYWSGINPNETTSSNKQKNFIVTNFNHVTNYTTLEPYEVWLKMADNTSRETLYSEIQARRIPLEYINDTAQLMITEKTDPSLQGMNGALTLSFVITMIMSLIGFLIYWILSIKSRTLQFGVLRAMGMSFREVIRIIGYEQILVSGVSIAMAFIIGGIASDIYVPLFQTMYDVIDQIPPFIVSPSGEDYIKIYALIAIMLFGGFMVLGRLISKININKALKLGED